MSGKYLWILLAVLLVVPVTGEAQVSPDTRLLQRVERDGAVFTGAYLDAQFRYQNWDMGDGWLLGPTFAMSFADLPQLELGSRVLLVSMKADKPAKGDTETGLGDINIWGKYQFVDDPVLLSAGLLFTLPTGSEKVVHPDATGEFNVEFFGAARYYIVDVVALIGHLGLRINADADYKIKGAKYEVDGETQFMLGGGVIFEATPELDILGELNFATEPYKDTDNQIEITGGAEYSFSEAFAGRGGIGIGLDDGSPDIELILAGSIVF